MGPFARAMYESLDMVLDELSFEELEQSIIHIEKMDTLFVPSELPSQQAKQTGVGEQHVDGRVSAVTE